MERMSKRASADAGHLALSASVIEQQDRPMSTQLASTPSRPDVPNRPNATARPSAPSRLDAIVALPEIIGGPTPIQAPRPGDTYLWKVQHGRAEKHVYVQLAPALHADAFEEPLRSAVATKGESVLVK